MRPFVEGNWALVLGGLAFVAVLGAARVSLEEGQRKDFQAAARWLGLYIVLRLNGFWLEDVVPTEWHAYVRVSWILAYAFGMTRVAVACALWLRKRLTNTSTAKIHRDVLDFVLYVVVAIPILKTQLKIDITTLLGTSAVLSLVLGFALQDTLSNLFSGLSLQLETPFRVGDWVRVGEHEGRVLELGWRSTRIESFRREVIAIPNSLIGKEKVVNFSPANAVMVDVEFGASYSAAPNFVKSETLEVLRQSNLVLKDPPPSVGVSSFGDSAITYLVRFGLKSYEQQRAATDDLLSRLWYRFGRDGIEIPFPQRVLHLRTDEPARHEPDVELVAQLPLFAPFPIEEARQLSRSAVERTFGTGEEIITEGQPGATFYVVVSGKLSVRAGVQKTELAVLERGAAFGEMSLLTGETRNATVVALEDCVLLELGREVFKRHLQTHPERLAQLAAMIEERKANRAAAESNLPAEPTPQPGKALARLRELFGLK